MGCKRAQGQCARRRLVPFTSERSAGSLLVGYFGALNRRAFPIRSAVNLTRNLSREQSVPRGIRRLRTSESEPSEVEILTLTQS